MSSKHLNVSNYYNGLEEAVIAVLEDSDSEAYYEFAIIPPEPSIVTDEEEGADEAIITASLPRDVPGNIEVFRSNNDTIPCGDLDSSDDEPLAVKAKRSRRQQPDQPVWRTCSPTYSTTTQERTEVIARQKLVKEQFQDLTPVFEKIFDDEVISLIITNTILYANQNNRHTFQLDSVDLKKFIGILILSGYHKLPREDLYWSYDEDVGVEMVSRSMPRQRFRDIKKNLHFVNNDEASNTRDKMFKIRPLADILINKFLQ
nr:piggyBac transposable element-derived protein 2-like [Vanessa tameamea]